MSYGIEIFDSNGEIIIGGSKLMNRVFYQTIVTSEGIYYYPSSLPYKPPIMHMPIRTSVGDIVTPSYTTNHLTNNGEYIGFEAVSTDSNNVDGFNTIITVFKIR